MTVVFVFGLVGMFGLLGFSLYRWMAGYSRSEWQHKQAKRHRAKMKAARERWRSIFKV